MRVLFVHQNFPGQFKYLAPALARLGHEVRALGITAQDLPGVQLTRYKPERGNTKGVHPLASEFETKVIRGEACAREMLAMRSAGFEPDVIVAHPGWGEAMFAKDVWPASQLLCFVEYHYHAHGGDVGYDPEFRDEPVGAAARLRVKNANNLIALDAMDCGLSPTHWQAGTVPPQYRDRIRVIFDGIETNTVRPDPQATVVLSRGTPRERTLRAGDEVVTFVNRNLEPYRGYHRFMRALPELQRRRPEAVVLIVGGDGVSYGAKPPQGTTWKQFFLDEVKDRIDLSRVYFLGRIPYPDYLRMLQVSACHVYLTYPFVLSWSCIEAMSAGCLVVGSDTAPVREVIEHGRNGLLVDFFDPGALAAAVADVLGEPARYAPLRAAARETVVQRYDLTTACLPRQVALIEELAARRAAASPAGAPERAEAPSRAAAPDGAGGPSPREAR
jgi:glycosyltransferase involved in cell wall biosynthesis